MCRQPQEARRRENGELQRFAIKRPRRYLDSSKSDGKDNGKNNSAARRAGSMGEDPRTGRQRGQRHHQSLALQSARLQSQGPPSRCTRAQQTVPCPCPLGGRSLANWMAQQRPNVVCAGGLGETQCTIGRRGTINLVRPPRPAQVPFAKPVPCSRIPDGCEIEKGAS